MLIPKGAIRYFPDLDEETKNPRAAVRLLRAGQVFRAGNFIHYNNKKFDGTRDEYRVTPFSAHDYRRLGVRPGDYLVFYRVGPADYELDVVTAGTEGANALGLPNRARVGSTVGLDPQAINDINEAQQSLRAGNFVVPDTFGLAKQRRYQAVFRSSVLRNFAGVCCMPQCGVDDLRLLDATHITPWNASQQERLNPGNGLVLCKNHHAAFDAGLFTLEARNRDYLVRISPELGDSQFLRETLRPLDGRTIRRPATPLSAACLAHHRVNAFRG